MTTKTPIITVVLALSFAFPLASARNHPVGRPAPDRAPERNLPWDEVEEANLVLAKRFCVALRRENHTTLRQLIDPAYLERHGLDQAAELPIEIAPVLGIFNIVVASDGQTVLCLYETKEGVKEAMLLRTKQKDGIFYVVPAGPPDPGTKKFTPWILRTELGAFAGQ